MNKERRVGRRSVVRNLVKLTPEDDNGKKKASGPKKALFNDDTTFVMRRTLKPLHENNFQYSSSKSKSHEKLYEENTFDIPQSTFMEMFNKHNKIPLSPPNRFKNFEESMKKKRKEPNKPVIQSQELFHTLIDSPCTKIEKAMFNNALSSASKYLLNRHLESVEQNPEIFKVDSEIDLPPVIKNNFNEFKTPSLIDKSVTPKQEIFQSNIQTQTSKYLSLTIEDIEELKTKEIVDIRQTKLNCCELIKNQFREIELEIEKQFTIMENKVTKNYEVLLKKIQEVQNDSSDSQTSNITVETVKEKNYTRMTGAFGILNNLNTECSFLKTPKTKGKTREEMLNKGTLTPGTMSFVLQEQLMHLNSSS